MKTRIQNLEYRIQNIERGDCAFGAHGVARPTAGCGKSAKAGRFETRTREEAVASHDFYRMLNGFYRIIAGFSRLWIDFSRVFPHLPASSRITFCCQAGLGTHIGRRWRAELCGKNYGFLRIFPRFSTIFRTDQGRIYAIFGFPSPPQVRCPKCVVRWRETWSHFYG